MFILSSICLLVADPPDWVDNPGGYEFTATIAGGLVLYEGGIPIKKIHPIFPNFLVIDTNVDIEHELLKIQSDIKYTIVSFFHGKKNRF